MKKALLSTIFLTSLSSLNAQISVTKNDFATANDTVRISVPTDLNLDFTSTGANYNWDFSAMQPASQNVYDFNPIDNASFLVAVQFGTFAPQKYQASYFKEATALPLDQLTFLPVTISDVNQYTRLTNDSLTTVGFSLVVDGTEIPFKSDTIEKNYDFPIQYGDVLYSRGYTNLDMNPVYDAVLRQHRVHTYEVDGWGSITTPYGNFSTLRIKHEINENDSVYVSFNGFGSWVPLQNPLRREYEWWANGEKLPVLKIVTNEIMGTETVSSVEYRDIDRHLDAGVEKLQETSLKLYPNPVIDELTIEGIAGVTKMSIVDIHGKMIKMVDPISIQMGSCSIAVQDLLPGTYFLKIVSEKTTELIPFVKK